MTQFADNGQMLRNDAIERFANGGIDPFVTMVMSTALAESAVNAPHFDGHSLIEFGKRHYGAWRQARITGRYYPSLQTYYGSASARRNQITVTSDTTLSWDNIDSGADILWTGRILTLPGPSYAKTGAQIMLNIQGGNVTLKSTTVGVMMQNGSSANLSMVIAPSTCTVYPAFGYWHLLPIAPYVGGQLLYAPNYSAGTPSEPNSYNICGTVISINDNAVTLPAVTNGGQLTLFAPPGRHILYGHDCG